MKKPSAFLGSSAQSMAVGEQMCEYRENEGEERA